MFTALDLGFAPTQDVTVAELARQRVLPVELRTAQRRRHARRVLTWDLRTRRRNAR